MLLKVKVNSSETVFFFFFPFVLVLFLDSIPKERIKKREEKQDLVINGHVPRRVSAHVKGEQRIPKERGGERKRRQKKLGFRFPAQNAFAFRL